MTARRGEDEPYLLGLRLAGRRVVVVGGGRVAQRRVPRLLEAAAEVVLVSPELTPDLAETARVGALHWERRGYRDGDLDGAWYVLACTDRAAVNAAVAEDAERRRIWAVRADDAAASSAWTPATGRGGGVTVGVLAGGDPRTSVRVRDAVLPTAISAAWGGETGTAARAASLATTAGGRVVLVGGGPGDPGLITVRGRDALARADVVVVDRLAPRSLLDELAPDVEIVDVSKIPDGHQTSQERINAVLVDRARAGGIVVRLKGGDPFLFGRGGEEVNACARAGVPIEVVPGVSSAVAVPAVAGIPVTHRGLSQQVHVVSGHLPPGHPDSTVAWPALADARGTLVLLMAVRTLPEIAEALCAHGRPGATPVALVEDGTGPRQRTLRARLDTAADVAREHELHAPAIVVVGEVVEALDDAPDPAVDAAS